MLSTIALGMYYTIPFVAVFYFMTTQHQITITYYMFVYYFTGNFLFGIMGYYLLLVPIDRPIAALINLKKDISDAKTSIFYKIGDYIENFKEDNLFEDALGSSSSVHE